MTIVCLQQIVRADKKHYTCRINTPDLRYIPANGYIPARFDYFIQDTGSILQGANRPVTGAPDQDSIGPIWLFTPLYCGLL
jgi:hypothetical protein